MTAKVLVVLGTSSSAGKSLLVTGLCHHSEQGVQVRYVDAVQPLGQPDAIILPGTKSTTADLAWLCSLGWTNPQTETSAPDDEFAASLTRLADTLEAEL